MFDFVVENAFGIEEIDSSGFFVKLKGVELEKFFQDIDCIGILFEFVFLDEGDQHANHGISIQTT